MADASPPAAASPYRVLARKYRPTHFGELIGQAPMVRTLKNAFAHGRIPQAWMLTGVRGVGKTTTARILARALNYEAAGVAGPTVDIVEPGEHCRAIMEGRHVDVIEMDAASHTGISDIREITDAARYKPVSARYKVYIIDEVHMLSTAAFNGLLKTLEEPPAHVKFIFATTEIRKVPVTVLSRCQRFDLRRIDAAELSDHLAGVAAKEGVVAEPEALRQIARAAEGSVRDGLSLLDQAIAHGGGAVTAQGLREMLGLADRARIVDLFEMLMKGDAAAALAELRAQYDVGADPLVVLSDLAAFTHQVTRLKVTGGEADPGETQEVRERSAAFAGALGMAALSRMWQALLAGILEVREAHKPFVAAEMVLIRLAYMASLPDPDALPLADPPRRAGHGAPPGDGGRAELAAEAGASPLARGGRSELGDVGSSALARSELAADAGASPTARGGGEVAAEAWAAPLARGGRGELLPQSRASAPGDSNVDARAQQGPARRGPQSFAEVADLIGAASRSLRLAVEREMRVKSFAPGRIEVTLVPGAAANSAGLLGQKLTELTGERWVVVVSDGATAATLREAHAAQQAALKDEVKDAPLVRALLERFPDAEITVVRAPPPVQSAAPRRDKV